MSGTRIYTAPVVRRPAFITAKVTSKLDPGVSGQVTLEVLPPQPAMASLDGPSASAPPPGAASAAQLPDLVADIRSLEALAAIPDHAVDAFYFDGVTYGEVYNAALVQVLARKLKPGGAFLSNFPIHAQHGVDPHLETELLQHPFERASDFPDELETNGFGYPSGFFRYRLRWH